MDLINNFLKFVEILVVENNYIKNMKPSNENKLTLTYWLDTIQKYRV